MAATLNNLAAFHSAKNEFTQALSNYKEALQIYRNLAKDNPQTYLPNVARTLNNLTVLQQATNEFTQASDNYQEALQIYRELAQHTPQTYLPDVAMTAINISIFYLQSQPDKEQSLVYAKEALIAALPFKDAVPRGQQYVLL